MKPLKSQEFSAHSAPWTASEWTSGLCRHRVQSQAEHTFPIGPWPSILCQNSTIIMIVVADSFTPVYLLSMHAGRFSVMVSKEISLWGKHDTWSVKFGQKQGHMLQEVFTGSAWYYFQSRCIHFCSPSHISDTSCWLVCFRCIWFGFLLAWHNHQGFL